MVGPLTLKLADRVIDSFYWLYHWRRKGYFEPRCFKVYCHSITFDKADQSQTTLCKQKSARLIISLIPRNRKFKLQFQCEGGAAQRTECFVFIWAVEQPAGACFSCDPCDNKEDSSLVIVIWNFSLGRNPTMYTVLWQSFFLSVLLALFQFILLEST